MKKVILVLACLVSLPHLVSPLSAQTPTRLIVFGDSLSDSGNFHALYKDLEVQPYESKPGTTVFVPSAPYAIGGQHFTNGDTWVEQLAVMLGDHKSASPAALAPGVFTNYAVGRSRARANPAGVFNDVFLDTQVQAFLDDFGGNVPGDAVYIVWVGANDIADALLSNQIGLIGAAYTNIQANIKALYDNGARNFLIVNSPNLGNTPRVQDLALLMQDPTIPFVAGLVSSLFNLGLSTSMQGLALDPDYNEINYALLDVFTLLEGVVAQPDESGFEVVNQPCVIADVQGRSFCDRPESFLFWDGQHPTTTAHRVIAESAFNLLTE